MTYQLKHADAFRSQGYELGFDEILLENVDGSNRRVTDWLNSNIENAEAIEVEETERQLSLIHIWSRALPILTRRGCIVHLRVKMR